MEQKFVSFAVEAYNKDALSAMLVAMGINTLGQKESQENSQAFLHEITQDFELFKNFQESKKQATATPVIRTFGKNNDYLTQQRKSNILNILNNTKEKSPGGEFDINKLPPLNIHDSNNFPKTQKKLFTPTVSSDLDLENNGEKSLSNEPDTNFRTNSNSRSLISKFLTYLDLNPQQQEELNKAKQDIIENFPFTTDYLDNIAKEVQFMETQNIV